MADLNKKIKRSREIISVLNKHGLGKYLPQALFKKFGIAKPAEDTGDARLEKNIREAFEELGTTFIKLGQVMSLRRDIIPASMAEEFKKLLSDPTLTCRNLTHGKATERVVGKQTGDAKVAVTGEHSLRLTLTLGTSQGEFLNPDYVMIALDQATDFLSGSPLDNTYLIRRLAALDSEKRPFR